MVELAHAQEIVIDPNGNVGFAPSLQRSSRPQIVDIATPNSGGVSLNQYERFDVTSKGVVLNNSQGTVATQIAGTISGNANLVNGTAATIVNEVTSTDSSALNGSIEVGGDRAGVIIANPNGITCGGCNFINASDGTLTTGVPIVDGSNVRLDVTQGAVMIGRNGLLGGDNGVSNINLIGRTVVIDGKVTAIDGINVQGGAQSYDVTDQRKLSVLEGADVDSDFVVDGSEYGAMEAGRIQIIGNERGIGVRTLGALQSTTEGVRVVNEGDTTVRSVFAQGEAELRSNYGDLTVERDVSSAGANTLLYARHHVNTTDLTGLYGLTGVQVSSKKQALSFSGGVQSGADVSVGSAKFLTFSAYGSASGQFTLQGMTGVSIEDATILASKVVIDEGGTSFTLSDSAILSSEDFSVTTGDFYLGENVVVDGLTVGDVSNLIVTASGDFHNSADMRRHDTATITFDGNLYNEIGGVIQEDNLSIAFEGELHNSGVFYGVTSLDIDVATLFNNETGVILGDQVDVSTTGLLSNAGTISSDGDIHLVSDLSIANDGYIQGVRAYLTSLEISNGGGAELRVQNYGKITASTRFFNQGVVGSTTSLDVVTGQFDNTGLMSVETDLSVTANTIVNNDVLTAGNLIDLDAYGDLTNIGTIASYYNASLSSNSLVRNIGTILVDNALNVTGQSFENSDVGALVRAKAGNINTARVSNSGSVFLINEYRRRNNIDYFENSGVFASLGKIEIKGRDSASEIILTEGSALISGLQPEDATQELLLGAGVTLAADNLTLDGRIGSGGTLSINGSQDLLVSGVLEARQAVSLVADTVTITSGATVQADGNGNVLASQAFTNNGVLSLGGTLGTGMGTGDFVNHGLISASGTKKFRVLGNFFNTGVFQTSSGASIIAAKISNDGFIQTGNGLSLNALTSALEEYTTSKGKLKTRWVSTGTGDVNGIGTYSVAGSASFAGQNVTLGSNSYLAAEQLRISADNFDMYGRAALSGTNLNDLTITQEYRQYGTLFSEGALQVYSDTYRSYGGSLMGSSDAVTLYVTGAANLGGSLTAKRVTLNASSISLGSTSSVFASETLRLNALVGTVSNSGELVAGGDLYVDSNKFDISGNVFAKNVHFDAVTRGFTGGNLYGAETAEITVSDGSYSNYGLVEARDNLSVTATNISNYAGAKLASTEIDALSSYGISNFGELFGASKIALTAETGVTNQTDATIKTVSLGLTAHNFTNYGALDLYGFFGDVSNNTKNYGTISAETYFGLDTKSFYNQSGANLTSGDHLYIKASNLISNSETARLQSAVIDLRAGSVSNGGEVKASDVVNVADLTGSFNNAATGTIYAKTIALLTGTSVQNDGIIGQTYSSGLPKSEVLNISAGTTIRNYGGMYATDIRLLAQDSILSSGTIEANGGYLGLKSNASYVTNTGILRGANAVVESDGAFDNQSLFKATETIYVAAGGDIRNRNVDTSFADMGAKEIVLYAAGGISNGGGKLFGYQSLGLQADGGDINNTGVITGPDITLIAENGGVWSPSDITAGGNLLVQANSIGLRGVVRVTDQVSLNSTLYDIEVNERIETKRLLVDAARHIKSYGAAFRGSELTQLIASDIHRFDGNVLSSNRTRKLDIISGAQKDIYVQLREGDMGALGASVYDPSGHSFDTANWDVSGSVSLIADAGDIVLRGTIRADGDVYIKSGQNTVLGSGTLYAGDILHIEGRQHLKNYGENATLSETLESQIGSTLWTIRSGLNNDQRMSVSAGNKVQLIQNDGWFNTADWFSGDMTHSLSVQAKSIVVNSSHRLLGENSIYLLASNDIKQKDQVIVANEITYSAGRDLFVRFNPFYWRNNNSDAVDTGVWWDTDSAGLRGHTLLSGQGGTTLYAGRDITFQSGKVHTGGSMTIAAGRAFLSEPIYLETGRTDRPSYVGWAFSSKYQGVESGHDASKVEIRELRAYQNVISARDDITILAGGSANFIGTKIEAYDGSISIEALQGGVNMVAAPGFWSYNYKNTTTKKKFFGFYKKSTTYEYDAAEDIYKRASLSAANGNITIRATGENGDYASILSAGTEFTAQNINLSTPNGNISAGTYAERSITRQETHSNTSIFWVVPFGSSESVEANDILINYGNDFLADDLLEIAAPSGTLSITGGTIHAQTVNLTAAQLEINAAINSARQSFYSNHDNMITITTIQSGFERETAALPEIYAPEVNFNVSGEITIQGYEGATLNNQLINLIGTKTFDDATLGLASPTDQANAEAEAQEINQDYYRSYDLPGASDGQQFAYLDTLIQDYGATYHTIELRDHEWYDKQVQLNPAFKALLQAVASYITGGINFGIENAFISAGVEAATTNLIVGVVEGSITGELDMDDILSGAMLAGISATISSYLSDQINLGAGLSDQSPFANDVRGTFAPSVIVDRFGDKVINQVVSNLVYGQDPFEGLDDVGRTFLVSETLALAQFGIGELGNGQSTQWEGSVGHLILHGGVNCLALEAMNGDCVAGFFAGASSSLLAGSNLSDEQILELAPLVGAFAGYFTSGGNAINVSFGGTVSQSAIVNNYLTHEDLENLQADLEACRASSDGCEDEERYAIIEKFREISRQRDLEYYMCYTESCRIEHIAQMASVDDLRLAVGGDSIVSVELYLHGQHGLEVPNWLTSTVSLNIQNEARIHAECPSGDPQCVMQVISDIREDKALYDLIASIPGPDLVIAVYECVTGGDALACVTLAIEARTRLDIPRGQLSDYVGDVFSGTGIDPDQYYDYVRRKLDDDKLPITPEDYRDFIQFRNGINQQHQTAVNGLDRSLDGQGLITQTEVTLVGGNGRRARTDIVVGGQPGQTVDIPSGYTLEDLNGNPVLDGAGNPVSQVTLDTNGLANFEVKTGNACLTSNQSCVYNMQISGGEVVAVGENAGNIVPSGTAPSAVYVVREN
ncbi:filamentous hemagglutinin N-terminal domain-containing protein [Celeribacter sp.]|uniref:two-partner secretion domain-containing protein n=1 Tax=Celeribacter sp. TaxID=1890673 RepID=UPI003A8CDE74